jgi:hypothetical protein
MLGVPTVVGLHFDEGYAAHGLDDFEPEVDTRVFLVLGGLQPRLATHPAHDECAFKAD